jgi:hypothetical protein
LRAPRTVNDGGEARVDHAGQQIGSINIPENLHLQAAGGMSLRQAAKVLGMHHSTVRADLGGGKSATRREESNEESRRAGGKSATKTNSAAPICVELLGDDSAVAPSLSIKVVAHAPLLKICRALIAAGVDDATPLEAWRGPILALRVTTIGAAAGLRVASHGVGFEPIPGCTGASPVRKSTPAGIGHGPSQKSAPSPSP